MDTGKHLEELRLRVILILAGLAGATVICLVFGTQIVAIVKRPFDEIVSGLGMSATLQTLAPADGFIAYLKISIVAALLLASPWIFYQLWQFIAAGLYSHEKRYVYIAAPFSAGLFIVGSAFFLTVVAPLTMRFFILFNKEYLGVASVFTFKSYISYMVQLMMVFGLAFQSPIGVLFLTKMKLVSLDTMQKLRKYVLVTVFVLSALVTPPDAISQVALALPLYLLYELGILISRISGVKKKPARG